MELVGAAVKEDVVALCKSPNSEATGPGGARHAVARTRKGGPRQNRSTHQRFVRERVPVGAAGTRGGAYFGGWGKAIGAIGGAALGSSVGTSGCHAARRRPGKNHFCSWCPADRRSIDASDHRS